MTPSRVRRPPLVGELLVTATLVLVYDQVRRHSAPRRDAALAHGQDVLRLEGRLRIDPEASVNHLLTTHHALAEVCSWWYQLAHLTVTLLVLAWCYVAWPTGYRTARNALVLTNLAGLATFYAWPVAPPRFLPGAGFTDTVAVTLGTGTLAQPAPDQYGAMPSLHLAWATWVAATVCAMSGASGRMRWIRVPALVYPVVTTAVVAATGNHYLLDAVAGVGVALVAMWLAGGPVRSPCAGRVRRADNRPVPAAATP